MDPHGGFDYPENFAWSDRNFPTQRSLNYLYRPETGESFDSAVVRLMFRIARLTDPRVEYVLEEPDDWTIEQMASSPLQTALFVFLAKLVRARSILEIGTFVGLGSMQLARGLPEGGRLVTIEKHLAFAELARRNFEQNGFVDRVKVLVGEIDQLVEDGSVSGPFDLVFIDGGKERYDSHLRTALDLLSPSGFVIVDNVFFLGDAVNEPPATEKGRGVRRCLELASSRTDLELAFIPFSDGMLLVRKIDE